MKLPKTLCAFVLCALSFTGLAASQAEDPLRNVDLARDYIQAVPVATVENCKDNDLCTDYSERPVQWFKPATGKPCSQVGTNFTGRNYDYTGDCAAGWVDKETLDEFSMGLKPQ
jgi:hypothetical protein